MASSGTTEHGFKDNDYRQFFKDICSALKISSFKNSDVMLFNPKL